MEARATEATAIKAQAKKVKRVKAYEVRARAFQPGKDKWSDRRLIGPKSQSEEPAESDEHVNFVLVLASVRICEG